MYELSISVVVCTYNGEKYIGEQMESVLRQSRKADEIIIIDDKSTDQTYKVLYQLSERHSRIELFQNNRNLGYLDNFSSAIKKTTKEVIVLCDQDDIWSLNKLEMIEKYFLMNNASLAVFSNGFIIDDESSMTGQSLWDLVGFQQDLNLKQGSREIFTMMLKKDIITGAAFAFRESMKTYIFPIDNRYVHDTWIGTLAAIQGRIGIINEQLISYRIHNTQSIGLKNKSILERITELYRVDKKQYMQAAIKCRCIIERIKKSNIEVADFEMKMLANKEVYFINRTKYNPRFIVRIFQVMNNVLKGNYRMYSNSFLSPIKDMFNIQKKVIE